MYHAKLLLFCLLAMLVSGCEGPTGSNSPTNGTTASRLPDGARERPLRVMLIPADGGTEQGTIADFEPIFAAITREYDLHFEIRVGQAYNAVVEGMVNGKVDIAFLGLACLAAGFLTADRDWSPIAAAGPIENPAAAVLCGLGLSLLIAASALMKRFARDS